MTSLTDSCSQRFCSLWPSSRLAHSPHLGLTTYSATLAFEIEVGREYKFHAKRGGLVDCNPFWARIVDAEDGKTIAGRPPQ